MDGESRIVPVREGYDRWASGYDADDNPLLPVDDRAYAPLLARPDLGGLTVCDLGCGTGRQSLKLAERGARVTGVDVSPKMLEQARAKAGALPATFIEHDLERRLPFADGTFDLAVSSLVLEHVKDLRAFFAEARRICRPGARLFLTAMHPAMLLLGKRAAFKDPVSGAKVLPEGHPHQISDFVNAALAAGLRLTGLRELMGDAELARAMPRGEKYLGWPMVVALELGA